MGVAKNPVGAGSPPESVWGWTSGRGKRDHPERRLRGCVGILATPCGWQGRSWTAAVRTG